MVYAHPPVVGTATDDHDGITAVLWGPGRGGLWVHTWATATPEWITGAARIGRVLAELPHEQVLARAIRGSQRPPLDPDAAPPTTDHAADDFAAGLLPNLRRAPIPPSFLPAHGYDWRGLTPMEFTDMQGWPGYLPSNGEGMDADAKTTLERTILATWLLMGQTLVRSEQLTAPRAARRRIAREDPHLDPTVRYIDLRRARTEPSDHTTDEDRASTREYRHRWIVRGIIGAINSIPVATTTILFGLILTWRDRRTNRCWAASESMCCAVERVAVRPWPRRMVVTGGCRCLIRCATWVHFTTPTHTHVDNSPATKRPYTSANRPATTGTEGAYSHADRTRHHRNTRHSPGRGRGRTGTRTPTG